MHYKLGFTVNWIALRHLIIIIIVIIIIIIIIKIFNIMHCIKAYNENNKLIKYISGLKESF